jgi:hypothetical protein
LSSDIAERKFEWLRFKDLRVGRLKRRLKSNFGMSKVFGLKEFD